MVEVRDGFWSIHQAKRGEVKKNRKMNMTIRIDHIKYSVVTDIDPHYRNL